VIRRGGVLFPPNKKAAPRGERQQFEIMLREYEEQRDEEDIEALLLLL